MCLFHILLYWINWKLYVESAVIEWNCQIFPWSFKGEIWRWMELTDRSFVKEIVRVYCDVWFELLHVYGKSLCLKRSADVAKCTVVRLSLLLIGSWNYKAYRTKFHWRCNVFHSSPRIFYFGKYSQSYVRDTRKNACRSLYKFRGIFVLFEPKLEQVTNFIKVPDIIFCKNPADGSWFVT